MKREAVRAEPELGAPFAWWRKKSFDSVNPINQSIRIR
jgi:hypothetical protein